MKKLLSLILTLTLILPCISAFALEASAESDYEKLWGEKMDYEEKPLRFSTGSTSFGPGFYGSYSGEGGTLWGSGFDFIPFTEQGQKLTYNYYTPDEEYSTEIYDKIFNKLPYSLYWENYWETGAYVCEEFADTYYGASDGYDPKTGLEIHRSAYRHVVQTLGLTPDELREAYRKMKEEPEYARALFSELTDEQYEKYTEHLKNISIPENFKIEAACMKDDEIGESLLAVPGMVYIKEIGSSIHARWIFMYELISVDTLLEFDMTTNSFSIFIQDMKDYFEKGNKYMENYGMVDAKGRTARQILDILVSEHEYQLANPPQTGEVLYLIPVAIVSLALGALVIYPRRRKIDNI